MAKYILLPLLFCAFFLGFNENLSANILKNIENQPINQDVCTLPPPDSFRIASLSPNSATLAWHPIGSGLTHQIKIFKKVPIGDWILVNTINNVPGTEITINGLDLSVEHRATIATNCSENDPSLLKSDIDRILFIIDLTLAGRTPINPTIFEGSGAINYETNNWVGFSITGQGNSGATGQVQYFELDEGIYGGSTLIPVVKRTGDFWLVATNDAGQYPLDPFPLKITIMGSYTFGIYHLEGQATPKHVGNLYISQFNSITKTVNVQISPIPAWNKNYKFERLTATEAMFNSPVIENNRDKENDLDLSILSPENSAVVQSPFGETLNISIHNLHEENQNVLIELFTTSGQIISSNITENPSEKITLQTESLPAGLYIVRIEIDGKSQLVKVVKTNRVVVV